MNDDVSILTGLRAGEPHAARALWNRLSPLVFRTLRRMIGPDPDAEDLAQDVFMTVLRRAHSLRDPSALGSFICSIAQFAVRDVFRGRLRHQRFDRHLNEVTNDVVTVDVDGREALLRFTTILARLRPQERMVFALRFIEGMKCNEIASALGVSLATVKRRLKRARSSVALVALRDPVLRGYLTTSPNGGELQLERHEPGPMDR
jgi:RNA polymerase sigma-70 factor (ECF subfamily)